MSSSLHRWEARLFNATELHLPTDYPRPFPMRTVDAELSHSIADDSAMAILHLAIHLKACKRDSSQLHSMFYSLLLPFSYIDTLKKKILSSPQAQNQQILWSYE
jgi:L-aminoadipate-semialdehyde dehydrogenase